MSEFGGVVAGLGVVLLAIVALARYLLSDRSVAATHTEQIAALTATVARLEAKIEQLEQANVVQRSIKHDIRQDLTKAVFPLEMVRDAEDFETVEKLRPIIAKFLDDFTAREAARRELERSLAIPSVLAVGADPEGDL